MKIFQKSLFLLLVACSLTHAANNTTPAKIASIETRQSGLHAIFLNTPIPNEGCNLQDRVILVESDPSYKTMYSTLLMAAASGYNAVLRVNGCTPIDNPNPSGLQSPRVIKVQIYID
jgi:hypothetical protein